MSDRRIVGLLVGLVGLGIPAACDRDGSRRESELAAEHARLEAELAGLRAERDRLQARRDELGAEIAALQGKGPPGEPVRPPPGWDGRRSAAMASQPSPDARWVLEPSLHDGTLVRLTVRKAGEGTIADSVDTRESDAMKWVAGWVDATSYVFWGADMGTRWVRAFDGNTWSERPISEADCDVLERLFEAKFGERRGNCLRPE